MNRDPISPVQHHGAEERRKSTQTIKRENENTTNKWITMSEIGKHCRARGRGIITEKNSKEMSRKEKCKDSEDTKKTALWRLRFDARSGPMVLYLCVVSRG